MALRSAQLLQHIRRLMHRPLGDPATDATLLERFARDRDQEAFAWLVARHGPLVLRLARRLLRLRNLSGQTSLTVTQEVLAEMLGTRRNAVSLAAHAMQDAGLIRYSRGTLEIVDPERLEQLACECYHSVTAYRELLERG